MAEAIINLKVVTVNGGIKVVAVSMAAIVRLARKPINRTSPIFFTIDRPEEDVTLVPQSALRSFRVGDDRNGKATMGQHADRSRVSRAVQFNRNGRLNGVKISETHPVSIGLTQAG